MAMYCEHMLQAALVLAERNPAYQDLATKFFEHFALIALALNDQDLWDEDDGFYYDQLRFPDGRRLLLRARSIVGLLPMAAVATVDAATMERLNDFSIRARWFMRNRPEARAVIREVVGENDDRVELLSIVDQDRLVRLLAAMLDPQEFLSDHGIRGLSRRHLAEPLEVEIDGYRAVLDYEPGEATSTLYGGNSNWRGPVWMPINYLLVQVLRRYHEQLGEDFRVEFPTGSGSRATLAEVADALSDRLIGLFVEDETGRRPVFGSVRIMQEDPAWRDLILFYEYFHGDTGAGLGASHQTGWTGLVADLIIQRRRGAATPPPAPSP